MMNELEAYVIEQIRNIIPEFQKIEFRATVGDTSRSMEFFVTINGERKQCYELADEGIISDEALDNIFSLIADFIRKSKGYKKGEVNKVSF